MRVRLDEVKETVEEARDPVARGARVEEQRTLTASSMDADQVEDRADRERCDRASDLAQEDPFAGLPDPAELAEETPDLKLFDAACGAVNAGKPSSGRSARRRPHGIMTSASRIPKGRALRARPVRSRS